MTGIYMGVPSLRQMSKGMFDETMERLRVFLNDDDIRAIRCIFRDDETVGSAKKGKK